MGLLRENLLSLTYWHSPKISMNLITITVNSMQFTLIFPNLLIQLITVPLFSSPSNLDRKRAHIKILFFPGSVHGYYFIFDLTRFSWSDLRSNKIVNKNQDRGWMRDGPRCPKQVSLKSDLILPPTKFSKVYFFQRLSTSRIFLMNIS